MHDWLPGTEEPRRTPFRHVLSSPESSLLSLITRVRSSAAVQTGGSVRDRQTSGSPRGCPLQLSSSETADPDLRLR